jgi:hypothetical protein
MATAADIINRALRTLAVIGEGESGNANQLADGLVSLNDLVEAWANENLMIYATTQDSKALTPSDGTYTIGSGANINSTRPMRLERAFVRDSSGIDHALQVINREQYQAISDKTVESAIPELIYLDVGYPTSTITLYPVPSAAYTLYIDTKKSIGTFAATSTSVSLPPGYERALRLNLAVEMAPEYEVSSAHIEGLALEAKNKLKRTNHVAPIARFDSVIPTRAASYDIYSG